MQSRSQAVITSQRVVTRRRFQVWITAASVTIAVAMAVSFALLLVRNHFAFYDDEGFMLMTLRQYVAGLPLYDRTYTEYGPFYYVLFGNLLRFAGVTHDSIRLITILCWLLVAAGWATCVWLWRRSLGWTLVAFLATVSVLRVLTSEPGHPHGLVLLLYAGTFLAASLYCTSPVLARVAIGAASAALLLTKVNVGGFMVAALAAAFVACLYPERRPRALERGVPALCTLLPVVLMHAQFNNSIAVIQCAIYTFGIWTVLDAMRRNAMPDLDWSGFGWIAIGFLGSVLLTFGIVYLHGTSVSGFVEGVILQPLKFSGVLPFQAPRNRSELYLDVYLQMLCCAGGVALWIYQRFRGGIPRYFRAAVALVVIVAAVLFPRLATSIAPGVMWMFVPEPGGKLWTPTSRMPVFFVCVAATLGILMVYPVPGTQSGIAAALIVLAAFGAVVHLADDLVEVIAGWRVVTASDEWLVYGFVLCATLTLSAWHVTEALVRPGRAAEYLPNSRLIELSTRDYRTFSEISFRASSRCDTLVTIPGMNSFNIWSDLPHPNGSIVSSAMVLFDERVQQQLTRDFLASSRPCVVWNARLARWSARFRPHRTRQPFIDLVHYKLIRVYEQNGYEIRVPRDQASQWH